ncbi:hypothetical protein ACELLULO517_07665 [Acidisoma cellulosilytica]|uniref:Uncharacterized protein n=1 Tax=Acidisoma cellulosilyticum TaxID=2802395 RepID=A0A963YZN4_9PROT|nr:hypothetical protein [Acidisoma cellulosilyticum]MCB8880108.1 hypothetical protein [Acidisoma cellulosilyticum]
MIITKTKSAFIISAQSDCGRITYKAPYAVVTGDGNLSVDGRPVYRGSYFGADGFVSKTDRVSGEDWQICCDLMSAVDDSNRKESKAAAERVNDKDWAREDAEEAALNRVGYYR